MADRVTIAGAVAQRPGVAGHAAVFVHWALGFKRLGWDVLFVDRFDPGTDADAQRQWMQTVFDGAGLDGCWAVLGEDGTAIGRPRQEVVDHARDSELLLNVMGYLDDEEVLAAARRRVFLDIDPGFGQMWRDLGLADVFAGHDDFVTVGLGLAAGTSRIPSCGLDWIGALPPVDVASWEPGEGDGERFTSVATWRGIFAPVEHEGHLYGLRVHEFRKLFELPRRTSERFEIALSIDPWDEADLAALREHGWQLEDPAEVARDPHAYATYVRGSKAELNIAKSMYVDTHSGWFSDRSACYLAAGRPVLAQDTGFSAHLPTGDGLLAFATLDEAAAGADDVAARLARHREAARELAREHLDAPVVVQRLLHDLTTTKGT